MFSYKYLNIFFLLVSLSFLGNRCGDSASSAGNLSDNVPGDKARDDFHPASGTFSSSGTGTSDTHGEHDSDSQQPPSPPEPEVEWARTQDYQDFRNSELFQFFNRFRGHFKVNRKNLNLRTTEDLDGRKAYGNTLDELLPLVLSEEQIREYEAEYRRLLEDFTRGKKRNQQVMDHIQRVEYEGAMMYLKENNKKVKARIAELKEEGFTATALTEQDLHNIDRLVVMGGWLAEQLITGDYSYAINDIKNPDSFRNLLRTDDRLRDYLVQLYLQPQK